MAEISMEAYVSYLLASPKVFQKKYQILVIKLFCLQITIIHQVLTIAHFQKFSYLSVKRY